MQAFLEFVVRNLVDFPDDVVVGVRAGQGKTVYELRVNRSDVGKLVGKSGQTIDAIRSLVSAANSKTAERIHVEIADEGRSHSAAPLSGTRPPQSEPAGES